jgi:hypothetical protein
MTMMFKFCFYVIVYKNWPFVLVLSFVHFEHQHNQDTEKFHHLQS